MKVAYPVVITKDGKYFIASVPDCEIDTQGENIINAIEMARDAISIWCLAEMQLGRELPKATEISSIKHNEDEIITLVDADIEAYRKKPDYRTVRKNLTLPSWLNEKAELANINFSAILQKALKEELKLAE